MAITTDGLVQAVRLKYGDTSRVIVETDSGHRIPTTQHEIAKSYKLIEIGRKELARQWNDLKEIIDAWWEHNRHLAKAAYVAEKGDDYLFLVVTNVPQMNPELENSLSELDLKVAQNEHLELIHLDVMAVPDFGPKSVQAFLPKLQD